MMAIRRSIGSPAGIVVAVATRVATRPVFFRGSEHTLLSEPMLSLWVDWLPTTDVRCVGGRSELLHTNCDGARDMTTRCVRQGSATKLTGMSRRTRPINWRLRHFSDLWRGIGFVKQALDFPNSVVAGWLRKLPRVTAH